jgi:hypothetical protein
LHSLEFSLCCLRYECASSSWSKKAAARGSRSVLTFMHLLLCLYLCCCCTCSCVPLVLTPWPTEHTGKQYSLSKAFLQAVLQLMSLTLSPALSYAISTITQQDVVLQCRRGVSAVGTALEPTARPYTSTLLPLLLLPLLPLQLSLYMLCTQCAMPPGICLCKLSSAATAVSCRDSKYWWY